MFGGSFFDELGFNRKLQKLREKLKTGDETKQSSCNQCSFCCWQKPCNLSKDDIGVMAKYFGLTPNALFKTYLVVDTAGADDGCFTLTPIRKEWKKYAGKYLPCDASFDINTPCLFLDEELKKCALHDLAKPSGGRNFKCWADSEETICSFTKEYLMKKVGWDGDDDDFNWDDDEDINKAQL